MLALGAMTYIFWRVCFSLQTLQDHFGDLVRWATWKTPQL
jgi:hypothetical protein